MRVREDLARRYGFDSYAQLLDVSERMPKQPGDERQSYLARRPDGTWFVWEDVLPANLPPAE